MTDRDEPITPQERKELEREIARDWVRRIRAVLAQAKTGGAR